MMLPHKTILAPNELDPDPEKIVVQKKPPSSFGALN